MPLNVLDLISRPTEIRARLSDPSIPIEEIEALAKEYLELTGRLRQENQLTYYVPVSKEAEKIHLSLAHTMGAFGGKGSSKTDTLLAELCILATGIIPDCLAGRFPESKIKVPGKFRVIVESITTTLEPIILPKLQWWKWDGLDTPGGKRGHWGWIPKDRLLAGDWERSYNPRTRILTLSEGTSIQFMSYDQDPSDFASGAFHACFHDEPPPRTIWKESIARVARFGGTLYVAMTPPDEAGGLPVDWIYDQIYEPGQEGSPSRNLDVLSVTLFAENNPHIDQEQVQARSLQLTWEEREVFLHGRFMHLSNLLHPLFTDTRQMWCFSCGTKAQSMDGGVCPRCGGNDTDAFSHVEEFEYKGTWPVIFVLDPHPRKAHMGEWVAVTPSDELLHVDIIMEDVDVADFSAKVKEREVALGLNVAMRLMDPNLGESPSGSRRGVTWRQEFEDCGLRCNPADDNFEIGKGRINQALRPDGRTRRPRLSWHPRCTRAIWQYKRYVWGEWARYRGEDKDPKQKPREKEDDFPAMDRYLMNYDPTFDGLRGLGTILHRKGTGRMARTGY